jgi:L-xylulokinase
VNCFLGIDAGNTGVKAVLFDEAGRELARAHRETGSQFPAPGMVERDVERLRSDIVALIAETTTKSGQSADAIKAVGTSGHGNGLYLLDGQANPLIAIQSLDTRAAGMVEQWNADGTSSKAGAIAGQKPWPSQTPTLLAWMKQARPDLMDRAAHVLMCKDLVTHLLSGAFVSDVSDMGGAGLLDLSRGAYDPVLMDAYGLGDVMHLLPELHWPVDVVGNVGRSIADSTGLAVGTPVVAGFFDVIAAAVGSGVTKPGQASVIMGTWSINQAVVSQPVDGVFMACGFAPGRFMAMENSATSATNLEWVAGNFIDLPDPFGTADRLAGGASPEIDAPMYLPFLYGSANNPMARASMVGAAGWHRREQLLHAVFEGVAFAHMAHIERLKSAGVGLGEITISGGGARSPVWPQMLADIIGETVLVSAQPEAGALGAAIAAAVGSGHFAGLDEAAAQMVAAPRRVMPDLKKMGIYRKRFDAWRRLAASLDTHWNSMERLRHG